MESVIFNKEVVDYSCMDREQAILIFGDNYYIDDINHQYALKLALDTIGIDIESFLDDINCPNNETIDKCKKMEKDYNMCAIDYWVDNDYTYLCIQTVEYFKYFNMDVFKKLYNKFDDGTLRIAYCIDYVSDDMYVLDSFESLQDEIDTYLKDNVA